MESSLHDQCKNEEFSLILGKNLCTSLGAVAVPVPGFGGWKNLTWVEHGHCMDNCPKREEKMKIHYREQGYFLLSWADDFNLIFCISNDKPSNLDRHSDFFNRCSRYSWFSWADHQRNCVTIIARWRFYDSTVQTVIILCTMLLRMATLKWWIGPFNRTVINCDHPIMFDMSMP